MLDPRLVEGVLILLRIAMSMTVTGVFLLTGDDDERLVLLALCRHVVRRPRRRRQRRVRAADAAFIPREQIAASESLRVRLRVRGRRLLDATDAQESVSACGVRRSEISESARLSQLVSRRPACLLHERRRS